MSRITITREQLYEQVWSRPMVQLSKSYGLSDVGLAKLCRRHRIPPPPRGYWAKIQAGQHPARTPLPKCESPVEIVIDRAEEKDMTHSEMGPEMQALAQSELQREPIVVASSLRGAHPLITAAQDELEQTHRDNNGILTCAQPSSLSISVSKPQVRRSLLIVDALLKALQARDYQVAAGPKVTIFGQCVSFAICESLATEHEQPPEHDLTGRYEFGHSRFTSRKVPTGKLTLSIPEAEQYWVSGCRRQWRDGKKQQLENILNQVIVGLAEVAFCLREHARELEQRRLAEVEAAKKRQEIAQRRAELKAQQQAEQSRLDVLIQQADAYRRSHEIRQLVTAVRDAHGSTIGRLEEWCLWAFIHGDRLDPTKELPSWVLDEILPEEPRRW